MTTKRPRKPKLRYARPPGEMNLISTLRMPLARYFDHLAIALSTVCIIHCLAVPVVIAVLPVLALTWGSDAHFHALMLWFVLPTSLLGFAFGYHAHRGAAIVLLGAAAIAMLVFIALWGHAVWKPATETVANIVASLLLAVAHWRNFRAVRRHHDHH